MKGVVFTELFDFVEDHHSPVFLQESIIDSKVPSEGVYTATGTYPACEMAAIVQAMADKSGASVDTLLRRFGAHLFSRFAEDFPSLFVDHTCPFEFLASVENEIHIEVRKLYPDAELPTIDVTNMTPTGCQLLYSSSRGLGSFCHGLIEGCMAHFGRNAEIERIDLESDPTTKVLFKIEAPAPEAIS